MRSPPRYETRSKAPILDPDGFQAVTNKRNRDVSVSPTFSTASSSSAIPKPRKVLIQGIPPAQNTQKCFSGPLRTLGVVAPKLTNFRNGTATIESPDQDLSSKLIKLSETFGHPLRISDLNPKPAPAPTTDKRTFSVVIKGVEPDVTMEEIKEAAGRAGIRVSNLWRIRSRASNTLTTLVRVLTPDQGSHDRLLREGLSVFLEFSPYKCEESHPPKPRISQCPRCFVLGHSASSCTAPSRCPKCGNPQSPGHKCTSAQPSCLNCKGEHLPYSPNCPAKQSSPETLAETQLLHPVDPMNESTDSLPDIDDLKELKVSDVVPHLVPYSRQIVKFVSVLLLNLFPNDKPRVQHLIKVLSKRFFFHDTHFAYTGNAVHISCRRPL